MGRSSLRNFVRRMLLESAGLSADDLEALRSARGYFMRFIPARGDKQMLMAASVALALGDNQKFINRLAASFPGTASVASGAKGSWGADIDIDAAKKYILSLENPMSNVGRGDMFKRVVDVFVGSLKGRPIGDISLDDRESAILDEWNAQSKRGMSGQGIGSTGAGSEMGFQEASAEKQAEEKSTGEPAGKELSVEEAWIGACTDILNRAVTDAVAGLPGSNAVRNISIDIQINVDGSVAKSQVSESSGDKSIDTAALNSVPRSLPVPPSSIIDMIRRDPEMGLLFTPG
jgi:hypothetical protein